MDNRPGHRSITWRFHRYVMIASNSPSPTPTGPVVQPRRRGLAARLRTYLLTGLVIAGPIGITIWLAVQIISFIDNTVTRFIPVKYHPETYLPFSVPGLGVLIILLILALIGFLAANFLGRTFINIGERIVGRMPIIRSVYSALKQIFETVLAQSSTSFREVVLVEYPRRGIWALGFVTSHTKGEIQNLTEDNVVNVFLPTTPNPTSGFLLFVPRRDLVTMAMSVEDGIKMVISGGLVTPPDMRSPELQGKPAISSRAGAVDPPVRG